MPLKREVGFPSNDEVPLGSVMARNDGMLPRKSNNVCILITPLCVLNFAHGNNARQRSVVVESRA